MYFLILSILLIGTSCEKTPINPSKCKLPDCSDTVTIKPTPKDTQIVWETPFFEDKKNCVSMYPILYKDNILYSRRLTVAGEPIIWVNKKTGKIETEINREENQTTSKVGNYLFENLLMLSHGGTHFQVIDLENKKFQKLFEPRNYGGEGQPRIGGFGKFALITLYSNRALEDEYTNYLVKINMETGVLDTLFSITDTTCFKAGIESAILWQNPSSGDSLLLFQNRQYRFTGSLCAPNTASWGRVDIYAYNLSKRKMEWKQANVTPETGSSSVFPLIITDNKAFFQGDKQGILFDCATGKIIWQRFFQNEGFVQTNSIIAENKVIMKSETNNMIALDINNGEIVWENPKASSSSTNMIYHKGRVYWEGDQDGYGVLRGIRVSNGKIEWTFFPKNGGSSTYGLSGIAIDHENDLLYSSDLKYMQCIRLPK